MRYSSDDQIDRMIKTLNGMISTFETIANTYKIGLQTGNLDQIIIRYPNLKPAFWQAMERYARGQTDRKTMFLETIASLIEE